MGAKIIYCITFCITTLHANEIYVSSAEDMGPGTLRSAIEAAHANDVIIFNESLSNQTIFLNSDLPTIDASLRIVGPSGGHAILDGNGTSRLFRVQDGSLTVSQIDLLHPDTTTPGGAVFAEANTSISLSNLNLSPPGNNAVFISDYAQLTGENISILPDSSSTTRSTSPTFKFSTGSSCSINTHHACMTCVSAMGSGTITTAGLGTTDLDTNGETVDFTLHAREGTLRFVGNSTQPIIISPSSMLRGSNGSLYIANRGRIKTGSSIGLSTIIGDLFEMSGSTLEAEIAAGGASDLYAVGGNATLAGDLFVLAERGTYFKGDTFTFLTTDGVVNGTFDSTSSNSLGLSYAIHYLPQSIQIEILENLISFDGDVFKGSAAKVYPLLVNANVTAGSDLAEVITLLNILDPPDPLEVALIELTPVSLGDLNWNEVSTLHDLNSVLIQQRNAFCGNNCLKRAVKPCCPTLASNGLWVSAFGEKLRQGQLGDMRSFHTSTYGGLIGYDRALTERSTLGIAGSYTNGHLSWNGDGGKTHMDRYTGALYLAFCLGKVQFDISAMGSYSTHRIQREIPSLHRKAKSNPSGHALMGHVGASYLFTSNYFKITPFLTGEYFYTKVNSLNERSAMSIDLQTKPFKTNFVRGEAGLSLGEEFCTSWGTFYPLLSLSYVRLVSSNTHIKAHFVDMDESFTVTSKKHTFNEFAPSAAIGFSFKEKVWIALAYEAEFAKKRQDQTMNFNLRVQF